MQVKKASEPAIGTYQNDSDSKQVKSASKPSLGISNAPDSFQNSTSTDGTSNTMGAGDSHSSSNDQYRYRNQISTNNNESALNQSSNFAQPQGTASKTTRNYEYNSYQHGSDDRSKRK